MSRRTVLTTVAAAVLAGGAALPALTATASATEPSQFCVLTSFDAKTGQREGVCVWVPVEPPLEATTR